MLMPNWPHARYAAQVATFVIFPMATILTACFVLSSLCTPSALDLFHFRIFPYRYVGVCCGVYSGVRTFPPWTFPPPDNSPPRTFPPRTFPPLG